LVLSHKYFDGKVLKGSPLTAVDQAVLDELKSYPTSIKSSLEQFRFREALAEFMNVARLGNKYLADEEPWKIIKTDEERVKTILNVAAQIVANLAVLNRFYQKQLSNYLKCLIFHKGTGTTQVQML
jgi:methionyl-tRNA synthetase